MIVSGSDGDMNKTAYANNTYRQLARLARPYYPADGPNSWAHIQEVRRRARRMARRLYGRELLPEEYAAIMFHDNTKREFGGTNHGPMGADRAATILAAAHLMTAAQNARAEQAIRVHDDNLAEFPTRTAELLASADANPPDVDWMLNKSYNYAIKHGIQGDDRVRHILESVPQKYGVGGTFNAPGIYSRYYGDRQKTFQQALSEMDFDTAKKRIEAYRSKYGIGPDEPRVIHNV